MEFNQDKLRAALSPDQEEEYGAGLLGVTIKVPRGTGGGGISDMLRDARLQEIERRILEIEETIGNLSNPNA